MSNKHDNDPNYGYVTLEGMRYNIDAALFMCWCEDNNLDDTYFKDKAALDELYRLAKLARDADLG